MANDTLTGLFTSIANAIRAKSGTVDQIAATDFATKIGEIPTSNASIFYMTKQANSYRTNFTKYEGGTAKLYGISLLVNSSSSGNIPFIPDLIFCASVNEPLYFSWWIRQSLDNVHSRGDYCYVFNRATGTGNYKDGLFIVTYSTSMPNSIILPTNLNDTDVSTKGIHDVIAVKLS